MTAFHRIEVEDTVVALLEFASGAIQRSLLVLEQQGGEHFFGEPALKIGDLMRKAPDGRVLASEFWDDRVMVVSADGTKSSVFADSLDSPSALVQLKDGRVLVSGPAQIMSFGADGANRSVFADNVGRRGGVVQLKDGRVLVSEPQHGRVSAFAPRRWHHRAGRRPRTVRSPGRRSCRQRAPCRARRRARP